MPNLTTQQLASFNQDGYLVIKNFCGTIQIKNLSATFNDDAADCHFVKSHRLPWWKRQDDSELTCLTHSEKLVKLLAQLMKDESPVCHIQTKIIEKKAVVNDTYTWHQDYAHWYSNKLLFPDQVTSFMVALNDTSIATGCSQAIKGSHKLGRLNHGFGDTNEPLGADPEMVRHALEMMELVNIEMAAGDALFFHSNLLHRGQANISGRSAFSIVATYATQENLATNDTYAAWHLPIEVIPNEILLEKQSVLLPEIETVNMQNNNFVKDLAAMQLLHAS